jgi:hypothetical protein
MVDLKNFVLNPKCVEFVINHIGKKERKEEEEEALNNDTF